MSSRLHFDFTSKDMALWWIALCFSIVLVHKKGISATENNPGQAKNKAANYFIKYGYLKDYSASTDEVVFSSTLRRFQRFAGLKVTGELNEETRKQFEIPRCGLSDPIISTRKRRYLLQGNKWELGKVKDRTLTWRLENTGSGLNRNNIAAEIKKAFDLWQKYGNIRFSETSAEKADILVKFASRCHKDPYCFDGKGGTLAHAFYPYPGHEISGDVHFDDDETYVIGQSTGTDLLWVATHEIGHSLGLDHSDKKGAIMFPWYQGYKKNFDLTNDDIGGIVALYGAATLPQIQTPPLPTTAVKKTTPSLSTKTTTNVIASTKRPTEKSTERTEKPTKRPTEKPTEKPTKKSTDKPTEEPTKRPTEKSTKSPTERSTERQTQKPTDKPKMEITTARPTERQTIKSVTIKTDKPTERPTERATDSSTKRNGLHTTITPTERQTKNPYEHNLRFRCTKYIDAAFISKRFQWMLVLREGRLYLANRNGIRHGPIVAKRYYRHIDGTIDAAVENTATGETILFSERNFWIYRGFSRYAGPLPLELLGLDQSVRKIDAAFQWKRNGQYYLFSGIRYWRFNPSRPGVDNQAYPKYIKDHWFGIPEYLSEAVTDFEGITRFIKDDMFYNLIDRAVKADLNSPQRIGDGWMRCRVKKPVPKTTVQEYNGPLIAAP